MTYAFDNARIVWAAARVGDLTGRLDDLRQALEPWEQDSAKLDEFEELTALVAVAATARVHHGVALGVEAVDTHDRMVRALGADVWEDRRRALLFPDLAARRWCVRLHYHPDLRRHERPREPGAFDFAERADALTAAMDWAALGQVTTPLEAA